MSAGDFIMEKIKGYLYRLGRFDNYIANAKRIVDMHPGEDQIRELFRMCENLSREVVD